MCAGPQEQRHPHPDRVSRRPAPSTVSRPEAPAWLLAASELGPGWVQSGTGTQGSPQTCAQCLLCAQPRAGTGRVKGHRRRGQGPARRSSRFVWGSSWRWVPTAGSVGAWLALGQGPAGGGRCGRPLRAGSGVESRPAPLPVTAGPVRRLRPVKEMAQAHEYLTIEYSEEEVWLTWTDKNKEQHEKSVRQLAQEARAGNAHDENVLSYYRCRPCGGRAPAASAGPPAPSCPQHSLSRRLPERPWVTPRPGSAQ